jgi:organic radical activating enzyme
MLKYNLEDSIWISEIFTSIEGEGYLVGTKTLFVRLAGCHLKCYWCDTKYALPLNSGKIYTSENLKKEILKSFKPYTYKVNFTGGEPLLQYEGVLELLKFTKEELKVKTYLESSCYDSNRFNILLPYLDICKIEFKLKDSKVTEESKYAELLANETECLRSAVRNSKNTFVKVVVTENTDHSDFTTLVEKIFDEVSHVDIAGFIIQPVSHINEPTVERLLNFYDTVSQFYKDVRVIPQIHKIIGAR